MKQTINLNGFIDAFQAMGREDSFTYDGMKALFDYIEEYEASTGEEIELDVIALCCEYTEYEDVEEYANVYGLPYDECPHCDQDLPESGYKCQHCGRPVLNREAILEHIGNHTTIIPIDNESFIIVDY